MPSIHTVYVCVCVWRVSECVCVVDVVKEIEVGYRKREGTAFQTVSGLDRSTAHYSVQHNMSLGGEYNYICIYVCVTWIP